MNRAQQMILAGTARKCPSDGLLCDRCNDLVEGACGMINDANADFNSILWHDSMADSHTDLTMWLLKHWSESMQVLAERLMREYDISKKES